MEFCGHRTSFDCYRNAGKSGLLFFIFLMLVSCASLPKIQPFRIPPQAGAEEPCRRPFVNGRWQLVHSVKAVLPNGQRQSMIGTIIVAPERHTVHCVLLSIEGIVLLDAVYDQQVTVSRAVPPFDEPEMVQGLIDDVRLLFLRPDGELTESGLAENRSTICRYRERDGGTVDVILHPDGNWEIHRYGTSNRLRRSVKGLFAAEQKTGASGEMIPERLELTAHGFVGYKLSLDLIEALPLLTQGLSE